MCGLSRAAARRPAADTLMSGGADAGDVAGTERAGGRAPRSGRTGRCDREGSPAPRVVTRQRNMRRASMRWRLPRSRDARVSGARCTWVRRACRNNQWDSGMLSTVPWGVGRSALHVGRREGGAVWHQRRCQQHTLAIHVRQRTWPAADACCSTMAPPKASRLNLPSTTSVTTSSSDVPSDAGTVAGHHVRASRALRAAAVHARRPRGTRGRAQREHGRRRAQRYPD